MQARMKRGKLPSLKITAASLIGSRSEQQDCFKHGSFKDTGFAVVCDGMGGHEGGKQAAEAAAQAFEEAFTDGTLNLEDFPGQFRHLELRPNFDVGHIHPDAGTTVVGAVWRISGERMSVRFFSVGDSFGLALNESGLQFTTPIEGIGSWLFNFWSPQKRDLLCSPVFLLEKKSTILLASDGIEPIVGNLVNFIRSPECKELDAAAQRFERISQSADLTRLAEEAVGASKGADNTTLVRVSFR